MPLSKLEILKKNKSKSFLVIVTVLFLLVTGYFYRGLSLSFPFIDEQYNFAIGKYLTNGEILYDDIITNHQPVTHIFSALVQETRKPNTTFSLYENTKD